ncbi:MAG: nucleotide 5'-monophosphate nucleosidase PpnN [Lentisphaerales bacterium]|nr:nucleotide 5'-monophosphate nucleosidase PpnN [Lentisphaerales bacterium]
MKKHHSISASVIPQSRLHILSSKEMKQLSKASKSNLYDILRRCALAVLNCGSHIDDTTKILEKYNDFDISVVLQSRGIVLEVANAPKHAFVGDEMITGIRELLFSVLRDILFANSEVLTKKERFDLSTTSGTTNAVFHILRNAQCFIPGKLPNMIVCWGGHSIQRNEYEYTKKVGYHLGLRGMDICTGCGPGAMKGPMKGATIGHTKQRHKDGRYVGITEPGIIAAESPNPIVNELVVMPDIEKRLEAFVRTAHGIIVFPGGVGTAEEILYLLGLLLHPDNEDISFPLIFTAPEESADYFTRIDEFIRFTLGYEACKLYKIIVGDAEKVATILAEDMKEVTEQREKIQDAYYFNWSLNISREFQEPFAPTHENIASLSLYRDQTPYKLAANLRRVFSAIVAGNVKEEGLLAIKEYGPYKISGDKELMQALDALLTSFTEQGRMKIDTEVYNPCYEVID